MIALLGSTRLLDPESSAMAKHKGFGLSERTSLGQDEEVRVNS